jgi:DNA-directed RNA polymerase specialized sigma24 family protein
MDRSSAVNQLPTMHAVAIRLRDNGFDARAIAAAAGIDEHEVPMLLQVAERKLTNLMAIETPASPPADAAGPF